jgi:RNA recognition motif-containing protein
MNIYVGNLAKDVNEQDLEKAFSGYGSVKSVKVIRDMFSSESKGFAFVEMNGEQQAQTAINELNAKEIKGKKIIVNEARPKNDSRSRNNNSFSRNSGGRNRY